MRIRKRHTILQAWHLPMTEPLARVFTNHPDIVLCFVDSIAVSATISYASGTSITANDDDWIIQAPDGSLSVCTSESFDSLYEPDDPGAPTPSVLAIETLASDLEMQNLHLQAENERLRDMRHTLRGALLNISDTLNETIRATNWNHSEESTNDHTD